MEDSSERAPSGERFPRGARLRSGEEIRAVFREGRRRRSGPLELFWRASPAGRPRVAFVVPRHGRPIVERNRVKRRLREVARREWLPTALEAGAAVDVVARAGPGAYGASFAELRESFLQAVEAATCDGSSSA
ncbi:MAG: ribonuclease P protein component [Gemmatimonadota bacterium]